MEHRHLGRSGLLVSELAYGNWITHGGQVDDGTAAACVRAALDVGITTFDTADIYAAGRAEEVLGAALSGERRESVEIFTKCFWPMGPGANERGLSRKHVLEAAHASLRRLGTDYIDLYQAHRFDESTPLEETLRAFDDLVRQGKVLYVGVSEWTAEQIRAAVEIADAMGFDRLVSNQPQYSMLWRVIEAEVVPTSVELGLGQLVWSPMAQGVLSGKYLPGEPPPAGSRATDETGGRIVGRLVSDDALLTKVQQLRPIAADVGLSMPALALAWVLQNDNVSAALVGASRPEQLADNVAAVGVTLEDDVLRRIDEVLGDHVERDPDKTAPGPPTTRRPQGATR